MTALNLVLIGEGLVLAGTVERARSRGHRVTGIFCTSAAEAAVMTRAGFAVAASDVAPADFIAGTACDVLLSINNLHVLDAPALMHPRRAAINYHNAPLPAYAGLRAAAWAILNGETAHGITWHRMEPGIDTGAIIVQHHFPLSANETTASLNARCTVAALASLDELFAAIEANDLAGCTQRQEDRTYYGRADTVPDGGQIDWHWPMDRIIRLVRACDWGGHPNDFGHARLTLADGGSLVATTAECASGRGAAGEVLAAEPHAITVACADGAVRLGVDGLLLPRQGGVLSKSSGAVATQPSATTVLALLADHAVTDPDAVAIRDDGVDVTRGVLAHRAAQLADWLIDTGLRSEDGVGLLLPAGAAFIAAALGTMMAGGAYVPLNVKAAHKRRGVEMAEAGITHVITTRALASELDLPGTTIAIGVLDDLVAPVRARARPAISAGQCAYRIFTSGSTGRPKAVEITHAALCNLIVHYRAALSLGPTDGATMLAHPTFDASVADVWPVLAAGGTVHVPPAGILQDLHALIAWVATSHCTFAFVPTAIAERLLGMQWPVDMALRTLLTGGEALHRRPPPGLPFRLLNTYGPTENTVDSLWAEVRAGKGTPTIGRPIGGVTAAVIDAEGNAVPDGQWGELALGGAQVARGYRGRPELTAERFERDPASVCGRRYRTGDRVRIDAAGEFEFHGRVDDQVQLMGIRVEPGEIEALLKADVRVLEALCVAEFVDERAVGLVAHVVTAAGVAQDAATSAALRTMLAEHLPPAVVPRKLVLHGQLPRTPAGKIDRSALAQSRVGHAVAAADGAMPASDPVERAWRRVLRGGAGATQHARFWDLGGDSLAAIDLVLDVEAATGVRVPMGHFLATPTLAGLQALVATAPRGTVVELRGGRSPPLVCWYGLSGDLEVYMQLAERMGERQVVGILSPVLTDEVRVPQSIETAVAAGLASLRQFGLAAAPALLGYSWSGKLAFEAARQLSAAGMPPPLVALVGSLPPIVTRSGWGRLAQVLRFGPAVVVRRIRVAPPSWQRIAVAVRRMVWMLGPSGVAPSGATRKTPVMQAHADLGYRYCPPADTSMTLHLFRDVDSRDRVMDLGYFRLDKPDMGWGEWTPSKPTVHWVDGDHGSLMKMPHVRQIADALAGALASMDEPQRDAPAGEPLESRRR